MVSIPKPKFIGPVYVVYVHNGKVEFVAKARSNETAIGIAQRLCKKHNMAFQGDYSKRRYTDYGDYVEESVQIVRM